METKMPLTYKVIGELGDKQLKQMYWDMAIGLNEVDNLKPSKYLQKLSMDNIDGKIKNIEVEEALNQYYTLQEIENLTIAKERECDLVSIRIVALLERGGFTFTPVALKNIHKSLFNELYDFAGEFRTANIYKREPILNGETVTYSDYSMLDDTLEYDFTQEKKADYSQMTMEKQLQHIISFTSALWQVHPFMEGNTRTVAVFVTQYLNNLGFFVNNELFKENAQYFRNALVRANYSDVSKGIYPTTQYLDCFFQNLLRGTHLEMKSERMLCYELFEKVEANNKGNDFENDWDSER